MGRNYKKYRNYSYNKNYNISKSQPKTPLTESQVYDMLEFTKSIFEGRCTQPNVFTPELTNQRLGQISLKVGKLDKDQINKIFEDPNERTNQQLMKAYSEYLRIKDAVARRTFSYVSNLPTFDLSFYCTNINSDKDFESEEYKKDYNVLKDICTTFNYKMEFKNILKRMLQNDTYFGMFRDEVGSKTFQELPFEYCILTGRNADWGFLFDFNMNWFLQQGISLDMYPNAMKKKYNEVLCGDGSIDYNPANNIKARNGVYALWTQTSPLPEDGGFVAFKWNTDIYANIPFLTTLFEDAINKDIVRELQQNEYIIASQKLLVGLIPLLKEQKSGQIKDALAISPKLMGQFLGILQQGLRQINVKGVPFSDIKEVTYDIPNKSIYEESLVNEAGNAGVTSSFIYTNNAKTAQEIKYNTMIDSSLVSAIYEQFSNWFSTYVNHFTEKYKFKITFKGTIFDRKDRLDNALKVADKGMVDFQEIANGLSGDDIFGFESKIAQSSHSILWKVLKLLPNVNTMSDGSSESGRPTSDDPADSTTRNINRLEEGGSG